MLGHQRCAACEWPIRRNHGVLAVPVPLGFLPSPPRLGPLLPLLLCRLRRLRACSSAAAIAAARHGRRGVSAVRAVRGVRRRGEVAPLQPRHRPLRDRTQRGRVAQPLPEGRIAAPMSKSSPIWPAGAAQAADWPRLAGAWSSLRRDLALRGASGAPAGRSLSHLVFDIAQHPESSTPLIAIGTAKRTASGARGLRVRVGSGVSMQCTCPTRLR